jgi:hypothetical protein
VVRVVLSILFSYSLFSWSSLRAVALVCKGLKSSSASLLVSIFMLSSCRFNTFELKNILKGVYKGIITARQWLFDSFAQNGYMNGTKGSGGPLNCNANLRSSNWLFLRENRIVFLWLKSAPLKHWWIRCIEPSLASWNVRSKNILSSFIASKLYHRHKLRHRKL